MAQTPAVLHRSIQFDMNSAISGRLYRIFVYEPATQPPSSGYPVVVTTDGNMTFPIMATMAATFELAGKAALIVGVGYATDDPMDLFTLRNRDLTPPTPLTNIQSRPGQPPVNIEDYGGSENFYRFLTEELRPAIAADWQVNAADQTLYGHSVAGMFTVGVLLNHPESFRNFVASSPSLWWNKRSTLGGIPAFAHRVRAREAAPRVLILVGGDEQSVPSELPASVTDEVTKRLPKAPPLLRKIAAWVVVRKKMLDYAMIANARKLSRGLHRIKGGPDYKVHFHIFEDEDHLTALPPSIARALSFALRS